MIRASVLASFVTICRLSAFTVTTGRSSYVMNDRAWLSRRVRRFADCLRYDPPGITPQRGFDLIKGGHCNSPHVQKNFRQRALRAALLSQRQ